MAEGASTRRSIKGHKADELVHLVDKEEPTRAKEYAEPTVGHASCLSAS
jgi:hypothetical protein